MLKFSEEALTDADIIVYVIDIFEKPENNTPFLERVIKTELPVLFVINKIDLSKQEDVLLLIDKWKEIVPKAEFFPISALVNFNIEALLNRIVELAPESPPYFPKDQLTDKNERFFVSEIIREKILVRYKKEIPYSVEVVVEEFKEGDDLIKIRIIIYVERDSQKGIIIGHKGVALKYVGTDARKDMEVFFQKKVYLELYVKVAENWRSNDNTLKRFGY
jgi:GTP-binding protein Era